MPISAWYVRAFALCGALAALVPALAMWGFTVDDALIPLRYAHHIGVGAGYRFDAVGPATDGVTPLPWAPLCAPLARGPDLLEALARVKAIGIVAWTIAGAALGASIGRRGGGRRGALLGTSALAILALAFQVGAWAASGMETGIATALATMAAASFERPRRAALLAGLAASLRPELVVWALAVAGGTSLAHAPKGSVDSRTRSRSVAQALALAGAPFAACAAVRLACFGRVAPLALLAKPSDLAHGLLYAPAAATVVLTPILAFAPFALARASALAKTLAVAALAHAVVVVAVGGDWMPYARLMVPIAPSLALVFVEAGSAAPAWSNVGRAVVALALGLYGLRIAPGGRHVYAARNELVVRARPVLAGADVVAALDVGWVGAATEARIVDLAGLTDPAIAALPGGHTSKRVDAAMLLDRNVDAVVVYGEPRFVEERLLRSPLFAERFEKKATIAFGVKQTYDVFRRR